ncbi:hypothetical protein Tco_0986193 [Tanacetum coccineum]
MIKRFRKRYSRVEGLAKCIEERSKGVSRSHDAYDRQMVDFCMMQVGSNPALARELLGADLIMVPSRWKMSRLNPKTVDESTEYICRHLEKDRLLMGSVQPIIDPSLPLLSILSKRQRVDRCSNLAGSATPMKWLCGLPILLVVHLVPPATDSTVTTKAALDSAGGINEFFLESDGEEQIGMSRVVADPDSDDEVLAEIIFRGKSISGDGVVFVDKLPDDEIVDPRVKVETVSEFASSPPRYFRLNPDVDVGLELWRDVNMLCQSLHSDDVEDFWRTQDEWIVCSWKLYPKSSVHVLDLTNGKTISQDALLRQAYECIAAAPILEAAVFDVATSFDSAVHRVHAVSFDAAG